MHASLERRTSPARHAERNACLRAAPERVFDYLDEPERLVGHMSRSSWQMGGGRMTVEMDDGQARRVGSRVRLAGSAFGIALELEEVVTEREPGHRKVWETVGTPSLLVVGGYRMGFEVAPTDGGTRLRVFIDYSLPESGVSSWLGWVLGSYYANWCIERIVDDAHAYFSRPSN